MIEQSSARRWLVRALLLGIALLAAIQLWFLGWVVYWKWSNPTHTAFMAHEVQRRQALHMPGGLKQTWVDYGRMSVNLKRAVVTAEDARFLEHEGVDWDAVEKAYEENRKRGRPKRGGSTISQQLAKNLFLSPQRSYMRKAQELAIALMIETVWDKHRILEVYLNVVEWGDGVFGAEAASLHYFGLPASTLAPEQAALMAAMLPSPRFFDHHREVPYLSERSETILRYLNSAQVP